MWLSAWTRCDRTHATRLWFVDPFNALECADKLRSKLAELVRVMVREGIEDEAALAGDDEQDAAAVLGVFGAAEQALGDGSIDQLDDAVVAQAKTLGGIGDGGGGCLGGRGYLEEQLMLLRVETCLGRGVLAEVEKGAEVGAELCESLQEMGPVAMRRFGLIVHIYIVSRYICEIQFRLLLLASRRYIQSAGVTKRWGELL
jgi:hypothetical protein